jgi:hypothetical protein
MKVYFTGTDQGDGSLGVEFFDSQEAIEKLEEEDYETYRGEGGDWFEVPDGTVITGITIHTAGVEE